MTPNPFEYFKSPRCRAEAQSNANYWLFEGMTECPADTVEASWNVFIREMKRDANRELSLYG